MTAGRGHLDIEYGDLPASRFLLGDTAVRIGRSKESHVHFPDGHVSKTHAEIRPANGGYVVFDLGSLAGVMVNGQQVKQHELADGDLIELGTSSPARITFRAPKERIDSTMFSAVATAHDQGGMARLARFFEFSTKLGGGFSLDELLRDVVDLAIEVTKAERGMLILRRDDDTLDTQVARGSGGRSLPLDGLKLSETLVRKAFTVNRPSIVEDINQDADLALQASIVSLELRSAVTLPLVRFHAQEGRDTGALTVFGVVYLDSRRQRGGFGGFDLDILGRLANDASAVIENARLMRDAEQKRRIEQEVAMAREVQSALMPEQWRSTPVFEVAGTCVPCHELGGDYVDQFDLGDGRMALVVADVCGKGVSASLLAASLQGALAAEIVQGRALGEVVARVNRVHCRLAPVGKFITMAVVVLDPNGTAEVVNAGHCPVLHVNGKGAVALDGGGMALGLDADTGYTSSTVRLQPGDSLVLYTDGVIECEAADRSLYGDERLARAAAAQRGAPAARLLAEVVQDVDRFRGGAAVTDDLSVIAVRRRPPGG
ncbi:MAG: SpoIIE family protein phosphatase [Planctomycetota bacterium]